MLAWCAGPQRLNGDQCVHFRVMYHGHANISAWAERGKLRGFVGIATDMGLLNVRLGELRHLSDVWGSYKGGCRKYFNFPGFIG